MQAVRFMKQNVMQAGNRVYISGYTPFRGLTGTIQVVDMMSEIDDNMCFYLVKLERSFVREAVWFLDDEVESISLRDIDLPDVYHG